MEINKVVLGGGGGEGGGRWRDQGRKSSVQSFSLLRLRTFLAGKALKENKHQ